MTAYQTAWHHTPEDSGLHIHHRHNLRYHEGIPLSLSLSLSLSLPSRFKLRTTAQVLMKLGMDVVPL
jgi:hypothetical protein